MTGFLRSSDMQTIEYNLKSLAKTLSECERRDDVFMLLRAVSATGSCPRELAIALFNAADDSDPMLPVFDEVMHLAALCGVVCSNPYLTRGTEWEGKYRPQKLALVGSSLPRGSTASTAATRIAKQFKPRQAQDKVNGWLTQLSDIQERQDREALIAILIELVDLAYQVTASAYTRLADDDAQLKEVDETYMAVRLLRERSRLLSRGPKWAKDYQPKLTAHIGTSLPRVA